MPFALRPVAVAALLLLTARPDLAVGGEPAFSRLPVHVLDAHPPSAVVKGQPGSLTIAAPECRSRATDDTRRRIVDLAVQEWAFFGFPVVDRRSPEPDPNGDRARAFDQAARDAASGRVRPSQLGAVEEARIAPTVAGYWAATPQGSWIVSRQNVAWRGPLGTGIRWVAPWSAAFISWVMCEAGLGQATRFQRAIAHHTYIDQAIRARDGRAPEAAFVAYDVGETGISPGDLLCSSRRPAYRRLAERRRQLGVGARSHCDVVVEVDEARSRILAIGGNVRGTVSLKLLPAVRSLGGASLQVLDNDEQRPVFAHMKLRAPAIESAALQSSPSVVGAFACGTRTAPGGPAPSGVFALGVIAARC